MFAAIYQCSQLANNAEFDTRIKTEALLEKNHWTAKQLIHVYFGIDVETLWKAVKENIPPLKSRLNAEGPRETVAVDHCGLTPRLRLEASSPTLLPAPP